MEQKKTKTNRDEAMVTMKTQVEDIPPFIYVDFNNLHYLPPIIQNRMIPQLIYY